MPHNIMAGKYKRLDRIGKDEVGIGCKVRCRTLEPVLALIVEKRLEL
jgi:hypothetical protein